MEATGCQVHRLVADVCVLPEQRVLLVRYQDTSKYDNERGWFLPDDFLVHLEHPDVATSLAGYAGESGAPPKNA